MDDLSRLSIERLPSGWRIQTLSQLVEKHAAAVLPEPTEVYREIGIRSHGKGIFHKEPVRGRELGDKRVFLIKPGCLVFNIVFAWEGAVGLTSSREAGMIASHRFPTFLPRDGRSVDTEFLRRFFLTQLGVRLLGDASPGGAGRNRTLNQKLLEQIPIPVPPLAEQQKIASILSSVDDAIEASQAVIDQLQVVKKAMMAELLTKGLPGRHKKFKQTELGQVPEEWEVMPLGELLEGIDGGWSPLCEASPAGPDDWGVLKVSAASWGEFRQNENKKLPSTLAPRPALEVKAGDLILSRANTPELVGRSVLVRQTRPRLMLSDKLLRLRSRSKLVDAAFLNLVLGTPQSRAQIEDGASGTSRSMRNISQEKLRTVVVPVPSTSEQREIAMIIDACSDRIIGDGKCFVGLAQLKSALISVLLTGEVRVRVDEEAAA